MALVALVKTLRQAVERVPSGIGHALLTIWFHLPEFGMSRKYYFLASTNDLTSIQIVDSLNRPKRNHCILVLVSDWLSR
jgi:hypothetical protein